MTDQPDPQALRVVLVDDRPERRQLVRRVVETCGVPASVVAEVGGQEEVIALLEIDRPDLVIIEIQIPVEAGLETIAALRRVHPSLRILVCSFHRRAVTKQRALDLGADEYIEKPISPSDVKAALTRLFPPVPDRPPPSPPYAGISADPHTA